MTAGVPGRGTWETTLLPRDADLNITWLAAGSDTPLSWAGAKA